jgi:hypothetical protein
VAGILTLSEDLSLDVLRTHLRFATAQVKSGSYIILQNDGNLIIYQLVVAGWVTNMVGE